MIAGRAFEQQPASGDDLGIAAIEIDRAAQIDIAFILQRPVVRQAGCRLACDRSRLRCIMAEDRGTIRKRENAGLGLEHPVSDLPLDIPGQRPWPPTLHAGECIEIGLPPGEAQHIGADELGRQSGQPGLEDRGRKDPPRRPWRLRRIDRKVDQRGAGHRLRDDTHHLQGDAVTIVGSGDDEDAVAGPNLAAGPLHDERAHLCRDHLLSRELRPNRVPLRARDDFLDRLERHRQLALRRNALHLDADADRDRCGGKLGRARRILDGEGQMRLRGDPVARPVIDQPPELDQRAPLGRRCKIGFVGDALLIESQRIGDAGKRIQERDREVIVLPRMQAGDAAELGEQRVLELLMRADAVGQRRESRTIDDFDRRLDRDLGAAFATCWVVRQRCRAHLPPSSVRRNTPRSGKSGLLSRRAISNRPSSSFPSASASVLVWPWRWNVTILMPRTPSTFCAAA